MKNIKLNKVQFRGQFGEALEKLQSGEIITMANFSNGGWEPTSKVERFIILLKKAEINFENTGESLRSANIRLKD